MYATDTDVSRGCECRPRGLARMARRWSSRRSSQIAAAAAPLGEGPSSCRTSLPRDNRTRRVQPNNLESTAHNAFNRTRNASAPVEAQSRRRRPSTIKSRIHRQAQTSHRPSTSAFRILTTAYIGALAATTCAIAITITVQQRRQRRRSRASASSKARGRARTTTSASRRITTQSCRQRLGFGQQR